MVHYKFVYFPVRGLGEGVRLLFHYAEQDFEDVRIQHIQFPELKPSIYLLSFWNNYVTTL